MVVVNDGSTDSTEQFLHEFQERTPINLRVITQENKGVSAARNIGIENASGAYVAFTDDDCIVPENWLTKFSQDFDNAWENIAGVGGPLTSFTEGKHFFISKFIRCIDEFNYIPVMGNIFITPVHVSKLQGNEQIPYLRTSNAAFRKECLKLIGGFDTDFKKPGGEDPDLCYRLMNFDYQFFFDKDLVVLHNTRESFASYFRALNNYIRGEFITNKKRNIYKNKTVRRMYSFIIMRKIISFIFNCCYLPIRTINLFRQKQYSFLESISFPFVEISSKAYALYLSLKYYCVFKFRF